MVIIANKSGKLGNRLILFAHFIACALENNVTVINPAFDEYAGFFRTTGQDLFCRYPPKRFVIGGSEGVRRLIYYFVYYLTRLLARSRFRCRWVETIVLDWEDKFSLESAEFLDTISRKWLVLTQGWQFRTKTLFIKQANNIREFFRPVESHERNIAELLQRVRKECDILLGVHIRQGDYKSFQNGRYFFGTEQYVALMKQVEALFKNKRVGFMVCSDEEQLPLVFSGLQVFFGTGQPLEDMYILAGCDYIMGPPSTFSMWASFYGEVPLCQFKDVNRSMTIEDFVYSLDNCSLC